MSSPCLGTVKRTYSGFELDILKAPSPSSSSSARSSCSSECSSSVVISTKRARTPRKRPNQAYAEAAILLSTVYPNVFNTENLPKLCKAHTNPFFATSPPSPPPPFPADYLIEEDPDPSPFPGGRTPSCRFEFKSASSPMASAGAEFQDPGLPDYDVESILDEEDVREEGIDSIMGKLSTEKPESSSVLNPFLGGLMGLGIGGRFGLLLGQNNNIRHAMRGARSGVWWSESTMVEVKDIVPKFDVLPPLATKKKKKSSKKKKKNKVGKEELKGDVQAISDPTTADAAAATSSSSESKLKPVGLGLKLNYDNIVEAWSDREFPFTKETGTPEFSSDALTRLTEVDLTPDTEGGGAREASVQRFREKRRTRLFSKKIRYQVRKVNADCRPRMKASGRFVRRHSPLQDTEEGSQ